MGLSWDMAAAQRLSIGPLCAGDTGHGDQTLGLRVACREPCSAGSGASGTEGRQGLGIRTGETDRACTEVSEFAQREPFPGPHPLGPHRHEGSPFPTIWVQSPKQDGRQGSCPGSMISGPQERGRAPQHPHGASGAAPRPHLSDTLSLSPVLQAFSVIAMFNVMKFSIAILPFSVKATSEANVSLRRMKVERALGEWEEGSRGGEAPRHGEAERNPGVGVPGWVGMESRDPPAPRSDLDQ